MPRAWAGATGSGKGPGADTQVFGWTPRASQLSWCGARPFAVLFGLAAFFRGDALDRDCLHIHELANAVMAQLASVARLLYAAKGDSRIRGHHAVHKGQPGFNA